MKLCSFAIFLIVLNTVVFAQNNERLILAQIQAGKADTAQVRRWLNLGKLYLAHGNSTTAKRADSGLTCLNQAKTLAQKLHDSKLANEATEQQGIYYLSSNNYEKAKQCYAEIANFYQLQNDYKSAGTTWFLAAILHIEKDSQLSRNNEIYFLQQAIVAFRKAGDKFDMINAYKNIADTHLYLPDPSIAEKELFDVLTMYRQIHYPRLQYTYDLLADYYRLKGDLPKQLYYRLLVIKTAETTHDLEYINDFRSRLATSYDEMQMYDKAIPVYNQVFQSGDVYYSFENMRNMVTDLIKTGQPKKALEFVLDTHRRIPPKDPYQIVYYDQAIGDCYMAFNDYTKAEKYYKEMQETVNDPSISSHWHIIHYDCFRRSLDLFLRTHRFDEAKLCVIAMKKIPAAYSPPIYRSSLELAEFKIDSAKGQFGIAITHYQTYKRIQDSLLSVARRNQIEELQIRYETDKKDKDIVFFKKQAAFEQSKEAQSRLIRTLLIIGLFLVAALLIVVYNRFRVKQKTNLQLEKQKADILSKNETLAKLLNDNENLLREVHHRVKNNLQTIISLLETQSVFLKDQTALDAIANSQHRIHAMSLIHQKLYMADQSATINMSVYITDLVEYLKESHNINNQICFELQIEPILIDATRAIAVGLILNEAITNTLKYAFPFSANDQVIVRLYQADASIVIEIKDNGRGLPPGMDSNRNKSFGLILIRGMVKDLDGSLTITGDNGVAIHIEFPASIAMAPELK